LDEGDHPAQEGLTELGSPPSAGGEAALEGGDVASGQVAQCQPEPSQQGEGGVVQLGGQRRQLRDLLAELGRGGNRAVAAGQDVGEGDGVAQPPGGREGFSSTLLTAVVVGRETKLFGQVGEEPGLH